MIRFDRGETADDSSVVLDLSDRVVVAEEPGLLSVAFAPDFEQSGHAYLFFIDREGPTHLRTVIARYTSNDGGRTLDPSSEVIVLELERIATTHDGGQLAFGPDGYLYIGTGDGEFGDAPGRAQDMGSLFGKMLRIDVSTLPYRIPPDNPFVRSRGARPEIFALGFRNPWRWNFDRKTGDLWLGDVGHYHWEEIDLVQAGRNYGWRTREANSCFESVECRNTGLEAPVFEYSHFDGGCVAGGFVYHGSAFPSLEGRYVFGDWVSGTVSALVTGATSADVHAETLVETGVQITGFAEDDDGELLLLDYAGSILRMLPNEDASPMPSSLKETGCADPGDPTKPSSDMIPYEVNAQLWSDGAAKERSFAIPDGARIEVHDDGNWIMPSGSVVMKSFRIGDRLVETRLLVRHENGSWAGYSYEWNEDQSDAVLLDTGKTVTIGDRDWTFPSRAQCFSCHTGATQRMLGLGFGQMDRRHTYPTGETENQLAVLERLEMFDRSPFGVPLASDKSPPGEVATDWLARSYLHANCSQCHRPFAPGGGALDLRIGVPLNEMNVCDVLPKGSSFGVPDARILAPGDPDRSLMSVRMKRRGEGQMPPIASHLVDEDGVQLVDEFIRNLESCE